MKLNVSECGRFLLCDGAPFFWLGDTGWDLFQKLSREEAGDYLAVRASQGFTVIQAVALADGGSLGTPNAYGRRALCADGNGVYDPARPKLSGQNSYWDNVDFVIRKAAEHGLFIGLLPTWGGNFNQKWGDGPEIFTPENARIYGQWISSRYRDDWNIVWILGGDRPVESERHLLIQRAMAEGLRQGDDGAHLITYHPSGESSSYEQVGGEPWLDFHMLQTSHAVGQYDCWKPVERLYALDRPQPVLDGEPRYEDHPVCFDSKYGVYWDGVDARNCAYWQVFSGACGITYGNHCVWGFNRQPQPYYPYHWRNALTHEGAVTVGHIKTLFASRLLLELHPDHEMVIQPEDLTAHVAACRGERYALLYSPLGLPVRVSMGRLPGRLLKASWFCPRTGALSLITCVPNRASATFVPPTQGRGQDWVLVLDAMCP